MSTATDYKQSAAEQRSAVSSALETPDGATPPDLTTYLVSYAKAHPDVAALWCFGVGFVLGWKLKPW
ncbi:hypothetical protein Pla108_16040 [Botrimarina colliarenosi]|uniref:Uncharacterized protein n=1 Tax=Botrimarina colliarenosi TaxID=2528001 RepID=A0A5C6ANR2_9BACT|nr:hypothetical protein [Botrimarina colliarenosi]TWU00652.1 hypothetical protein Pla108_16040 [Botrimarina colliarenosi]